MRRPFRRGGRPPRAALVLALLLAAAPSLFAESGRTAANTLKRPLSARPLGMGEAFAAADGGLDSLGYNPAGLARLQRPELATSFSRGIADDNFSFIGYAHPLSFATLTGGFIYYDAGSIDINLSNGTHQRRTAQQDLAGMASASVPLPWGLCAGATAKFFRLELAQEVRTTGYAADVGALWHTPLKGLNLGVSLQNLGPDVKFEQEGDPLPMTSRFGAAYAVNLENMDWFKNGGFGFSRFLVTADAVQVKEEKDVMPAAGLEMGMPMGEEGYAALRFGYMFSRELNFLTVGLGLRQGRWLLDYGLGAMKRITNSHHFTLGVKF